MRPLQFFGFAFEAQSVVLYPADHVVESRGQCSDFILPLNINSGIEIALVDFLSGARELGQRISDPADENETTHNCQKQNADSNHCHLKPKGRDLLSEGFL